MNSHGDTSQIHNGKTMKDINRRIETETVRSLQQECVHLCVCVCVLEGEMNEAASLLRHTDKTKQQKRMDNKRLLYPHCVIMRNARCVCARNRTDRVVWEREDVRSPVTSSYLILSVVASKSCLMHVKLLPSHIHTRHCVQLPFTAH